MTNLGCNTVFFRNLLVPNKILHKMEKIFKKCKMLKSDRTAVFALITLVFAFLTFHRNSAWSNAFTLWENTITKSPSKSRPHTYLALANAKDERFDAALAEFGIAVAIDPLNVEARYNLGVLYLKTGQYEKAASEFKKAISIRPDLPESYKGITNIYLETGQYGIAARYLLDAMRIWPQAIWVHLNLGIAYARSGDLDKAESSLRQANVMDPEDPSVNNSLGNVYMMKGLHGEALKFYIKAAEAPAGGPEPVFNTAMAYERLGDTRRAVEFYKRFISINPKGYDDSIMAAKERAAKLDDR